MQSKSSESLIDLGEDKRQNFNTLWKAIEKRKMSEDLKVVKKVWQWTQDPIWLGTN